MSPLRSVTFAYESTGSVGFKNEIKQGMLKIIIYIIIIEVNAVSKFDSETKT